jgi:uncharacterized membrane protein YhaH (DUF805 family)
MGKLFTMEGRIGRQQYLLITVAVVIATYAVAFVVGFIAGMAGSTDSAGFLGFVIGLIGAVIQAFLVVKRLHDIGRPGWHYWLFLIPLYNIYLGLILLFTPGDSGSNEYGNNPATV